MSGSSLRNRGIIWALLGASFAFLLTFLFLAPRQCVQSANEDGVGPVRFWKQCESFSGRDFRIEQPAEGTFRIGEPVSPEYGQAVAYGLINGALFGLLIVLVVRFMPSKPSRRHQGSVPPETL